MKTIPLSKNKVAFVDDYNYDWLSQWKWYALEKSGKTYYAARGYKSKKIYMHREIMGLVCGDNRQVDHINHNSLNNLVSNLRICTCSENHRNRLPVFKTSKYKGVNWNKQKRKWVVHIYVSPKSLFLGYYDSEVEAAKAYNIAAEYYYGKFAYLNVL